MLSAVAAYRARDSSPDTIAQAFEAHHAGAGSHIAAVKVVDQRTEEHKSRYGTLCYMAL